MPRGSAKRKIMDGRPVIAYSHWMLKVLTLALIKRNTRVRVSCLLSSLTGYKIRLLSWVAMHTPSENLGGENTKRSQTYCLSMS